MLRLGVGLEFNDCVSDAARVYGRHFNIELTRDRPFINLRLLTRRNFGLAAIVNVYLGVGL